jgi:hypothetical protein
MTSAGRISPTLALPADVVIDEAVRDEGTSLHYLPPLDHSCHADAGISRLAGSRTGRAAFPVTRDVVWTTDAPYRETRADVILASTGDAHRNLNSVTKRFIPKSTTF